KHTLCVTRGLDPRVQGARRWPGQARPRRMDCCNHWKSQRVRSEMSFTVAILGRPNVGKSTLFNRLAGRPLALVDDSPWVTGDRREGEGHVADLNFRMIDTAGLEETAPETLAGRMRTQTESALGQADVALLVID